MVEVGGAVLQGTGMHPLSTLMVKPSSFTMVDTLDDIQPYHGTTFIEDVERVILEQSQ